MTIRLAKTIQVSAHQRQHVASPAFIAVHEALERELSEVLRINRLLRAMDRELRAAVDVDARRA